MSTERPQVHRRLKRAASGVAIGSLLLAASAVPAAADRADKPDPAAVPAGARAPYMGWSSWSLQATTNPRVNPDGYSSWLNQAHVLQQADALTSTGLAKAGYTYVNIDAAWYADIDRKVHVDGHGRLTQDTDRFPDSMGSVVDKIHARGLKAGIYDYAGLPIEAYAGDFPILGSATGCTTQQAVAKEADGKPKVLPNGWKNGYVLDFSRGNPCGYDYVKSLTDRFADWGFDLIKLDGVTPSGDGVAADLAATSYYEVGAWHKALRAEHWPGQLVLSWSINPSYASKWQQLAQGVRVEGDVECYCNKLVSWDYIKLRWHDVVPWLDYARPGFWPNLDSLLVGNQAMDGLSIAQRQTTMTFWAMESSPLYLGDDVTKLDNYGLSLLTNKAVIAQNQQGIPARPVYQDGVKQVWSVRNKDGSTTVALYNLGDKAATVTADWRDLGLSANQPMRVRDLWAGTSLGTQSTKISRKLPKHGSLLLRLSSQK